MATFQSLPGFREFYPEDCAARNALFAAWRGAARRHGFQEYDAPVLEPLELYTEKSGEEIKSQLFEFTDKGGRAVALRPEMTPSLARLVAARAGSLPRPLKWFSLGEMYRYEKPQKGRLRAFYQFNADILGEPGPAADAECIALLVEALRSCGLKEGEFEIRVSDRKIWFLFLKSFGLDDSQTIAALAILDKWGREDASETQNKIQRLFGNQSDRAWAGIQALFKENEISGLIGVLATDLIAMSSELTRRMIEWQQLQSCLFHLGMQQAFRIDLSIVRGLAYYTGFVFEAYQTVGTARALAGGGRYDDLIKKLGGPDLPAVGFAIGDVTVTDLLRELNRLPAGRSAPDAYVVIGGAQERAAALQIVSRLRAAGLSADYPLKETGFGKQFKAADQCGAKCAVIIGADELAAGKIKVKDMRAGVETLLDNDADFVTNLRNLLGSV